MPYSTDWKHVSEFGEELNPRFKCRKCGSKDVDYRVWDSSDGAHTDYNYRCRNCSNNWWVEGPDY